MERDNIHYRLDSIRGFNKPLNLVFCGRDAGKTCCIANDIIKPTFLNGEVTAILVWNAVNISQEYLDAIENEINAFLKEGEERYLFQYKLSDLGKKSIMTINCFDKPIIRFYSYNCPIARIKMSLLPNIGALVHDEICVNPEWGEKYPAGMYKKFREIYTTLERKKKNGKLKFYGFGNLYSLYHPLLVGAKIDVKKLKYGTIQAFNEWAVEWYKLKPELVAYLKERNPFYEDEDYKNYALEGQNINDDHIRLMKLTNDYKLIFIFKIESKYIGVYYNYRFNNVSSFHCKLIDIDKIAKSRDIICFDFSDLSERTRVLPYTERARFSRFKNCMLNNDVTFEDINVYYLTEQCYYNL